MKILNLIHLALRNHVWHHYGLAKSVRAVSGETISEGDFCWRRWGDKGWEYNVMTKEDQDEAAFWWSTK